MFALVSDQHAHKWSQFASTNAEGVNSRLAHILSEMQRAAGELKASGGRVMIFAGDLFHTRGSIDPEVFNPTHDTIQSILNDGIQIFAIPGNHDLAGRDTTALGNAIQSLQAMKGFSVITEPTFVTIDGAHIALVPWFSKMDDLRSAISIFKDEAEEPNISSVDLIMHAGIDGVLPGLHHGLSVKEVAGWGFQRVFAGHYHNHKVMADGKVISIGALTHQTFSDVGTKAGFLLVNDETITYRASHAPSFVDIDPDTDEEEIPLRADGNYVRVRGFRLTDKEVNVMRQGLLDMGARGVTIQVAREVTSERSAGSAKGKTLFQSVQDYVAKAGFEETDEVQRECESILHDVSTVAA